MYSCSRSCLRRKARSPAFSSTSANPEAPLLFLYPGWYRSRLRLLRLASTNAVETREAVDQSPAVPERPRPASSPLPLARQIEWTGEHLKHKRQQRSTNIQPRDEAERPPPIVAANSSNVSRRPPTRVLADDEHDPRHIQHTIPSVAEVIDQRLSRKPGNHQTGSPETAPFRSKRAESGRYFSHNVRRTYANTYGRLADHELQQRAGLTHKRSAMRKTFELTEQNWREAVGLLNEQPRQYHPVSERTLYVRDATVFEITGTFEENVWKQSGCADCQVHVLPRLDAGSASRRTIVLSGDDEAIKKAELQLKDLDVRVGAHPVFPRRSSHPTSAHRYELSRRHHQRTRLSDRSGELPFPSEWSVRSFADYVQDLTTSHLPRAIRRDVHSKGVPHNLHVAQRMEQIFKDPDLTPFISVRALNYALRFACAHTELTPTLRLLFNAVKIEGLRLPIKTFDILIESALKLNDMAAFKELLNNMQEMRIPPQASTWAKLLASAKWPRARLQMLAYMRGNGLLRGSAACEEVAVRSLESRIEQIASQDPDLHRFDAMMNEQLGKHWLSPRVLNRMLNICTEKKLWKLSSSLVELSTRTGTKIRTTTLTRLVRLLRKSGYLRECIDLMHSQLAQAIGVDLATVIPMVFMTAWRTNAFNVCRVLWHFAATHGIISWPMQQLVVSNLVSNDVKTECGKHRTVVAKAAKMVVGTDVSVDDLDVSFPLLNARFGFSNPQEILWHYTPDDGTRDEQLSLAHLMIHRDLEAWQTLRPLDRSRFFSLLQSAFDKDYKWRITGFLPSASARDLLQDAIDVPLRKWTETEVTTVAPQVAAPKQLQLRAPERLPESRSGYSSPDNIDDGDSESLSSPGEETEFFEPEAPSKSLQGVSCGSSDHGWIESTRVVNCLQNYWRILLESDMFQMYTTRALLTYELK